MNTSFAALLCLMISSYQEYFYKLYISNAIEMKRANTELLDIKETLEEEIEKRSEELTAAHDLLLAEIIENNNTEVEYLKSQMELEKNKQRLSEIESYEKIRTEFFANISHELKTPLNVIFSAQQILAKNAQEASFDPNKYLKIIKQNCFRLIRLIGNLIDLTKIDSGYLTVSLSNNDIIQIAEDITLSVAAFIEDKNISLIFDTDIEECIIACDPENIERIMLNLLSNAVKFTPANGFIFVNIADAHDSISITVKDSGIGIPPEVQSTIFDRFVQADKSIKRNQEGSGIGLSLVKSLVDLHQGIVLLNSKLDEGTEIALTFPKALVPISAEPNSTNTQNEYSYNEHVEKISIEFSDIYF